MTRAEPGGSDKKRSPGAELVMAACPEPVKLVASLACWPGAPRALMLPVPGRAVSYRLSPEPVQVSRARDQARDALPGWGLGQHTELAVLIVSELVTNAIRHGQGQVEVRLSYARGYLRAEVHDHGTGRPARQHPAADRESGRGLELIDGLIEPYSGTRGVINDCDCRGKTVYVAVPLAPDPKGIS